VRSPIRTRWRRYRRGKIQVLLWATAGYALFYFVRKNLSIAMR
jgi:sugar phosphate permease